MASKYTVQPGETPRDVAKRYTGSEEKYRDLLPINPHMKQVIGQLGTPDFDSKDWHDGLVVNIPDRWSETGEIHGIGRVGGPNGSVGCGCSAGATQQGAMPWGPPMNQKAATRWSPVAPQSGMVYRKPSGYIDGTSRGKNTSGPTFTVWTPPRMMMPSNTYAQKRIGPLQRGPGVGDPSDPSGTGTGENVPGTGRCAWSVDPDVKPYWLRLDGDILDTIAKTWLGTSSVYGTQGKMNLHTLMKVNADLLDRACGGTRNGVMQVRIPAAWLDPPTVYKDKLVNEDGSKYTGAGDGGGGGGAGTDGVDRINLSGDSDSGTIWWILAGGVGIVGAYFLSKKMKKSR